MDAEPDADDILTRWVATHARPLDGTAPGLGLDDLEPLRPVVWRAVVVGLGEAIRFAHEVFEVRVRVLRFLVERLGFGALALEESPETAERLDAWVHGVGVTGPERLLDDAWAVWRSEEFVALLHRLRAHNGAHPDHDVRMVGIDTARRDGTGPDPEGSAERIAAIHDRTGRRVVYWGGTGHTAVHAPEPGHPPHPFPRTEGTVLRERFGRGYASVGVTFDRGEAHWRIALASPQLAESTFAAAATGPFLLDLTGPAPHRVAALLDAPTRARVIGPRYEPSEDAAFSIAGTPLRTLFDAVVHLPEVTSTSPLPQRDRSGT